MGAFGRTVLAPTFSLRASRLRLTGAVVDDVPASLATTGLALLEDAPLLTLGSCGLATESPVEPVRVLDVAARVTLGFADGAFSAMVCRLVMRVVRR